MDSQDDGHRARRETLTPALIDIRRRFKLNTVSYRHQREHPLYLSLGFITVEWYARPDDYLKSGRQSRKPFNSLSISSQSPQRDGWINRNGGPPSSSTNSERAGDVMAENLLQRDAMTGLNKQ